LVATGTGLTVGVPTMSQGGDAGRVQKLTDPRGLIAKTDSDLLGRTLRTVENYVNFAPSALNTDRDRTTEYTYDGNGNLLTLTARLPAGGPTVPTGQTTQYVYAATTAGGSDLNSNDVLTAIKHPGKTDGLPSSTEQERFTVNRLAQRKTATDRRGNQHGYTYDVLGRLTSDAVTTLGSDTDGAIRRLDTAYDSAGRPFLFTSSSAVGLGVIVNQVQRTFNGLGQLVSEVQCHTGAVALCTGGAPSVQYTYSEMAGGANHSRLTRITYPTSTRALDYVYATGLDDSLSRLSALAVSHTTLEAYTYLGLSTVVKRAHPEPNVDLTYFQAGSTGSDSQDQYIGFDRFGRIVDQHWVNNGTATDTDRFGYGYDRDG